MKHRSFNPVLVIIFLSSVGFLYRLPYLSMGLWRDEGSTYFNISPHHIHAILNRVAYTELNPPAFYFLMKKWVIIFGENEISMKFPALFFGILIIPAIYVLGCMLCSKNAGIIAAFIATFHPQAMYYSQEARPYTLSMLLCCLTFIAYLHLLNSKAYKWLTFCFFSAIACLFFYTQYTGLILAIALVAVTLILHLCKKITHQTALTIYVASLAALVAFTPWLSTFILHFKTGLPWQGSTPLLQRIKPYTFDSLATTVPLGRPFSTLLSTPLFILMLRETLLSFSYLRSARLQSGKAQKRFILFSTFILIIAAMIIADKSGMYVLPYCPIAWCGYGLWFDEWLTQCPKSLQKTLKPAKFVNIYSQTTIIILLICVVSFSSTIKVAILGSTPKSGIRSLAEEISQEDLSRTFFVVAPDFLGPTFGYYFRNTSATFRGFGRWSHPEIFSPQGYAEVWESETLSKTFTKNLQTEADKNFDIIYFIQNKFLPDGEKIRYSRVKNGLEKMKADYVLLEKSEYSGRTESLIVYKFENSKSISLSQGDVIR